MVHSVPPTRHNSRARFLAVATASGRETEMVLVDPSRRVKSALFGRAVRVFSDASPAPADVNILVLSR
jgi:hypothetical protein